MTEVVGAMLDNVTTKLKDYLALEKQNLTESILIINGLYKELQEVLKPNQTVQVPYLINEAPHISMPMTSSGVLILRQKLMSADEYVEKNLSRGKLDDVKLFYQYLKQAEDKIGIKLTGKYNKK
jgi:hypothetical protein